MTPPPIRSHAKATKDHMTSLDKQQLLACQNTEMGRSRWFTVDQDRIDHFARITEDEQFIHTDPVQAAATPFGGTIAHGFLSLSLLSAMLEDAFPKMDGLAMGVNYGFDRIRFVTPVRSGARVRGHFTLLDAEERQQGEVQTRTEVTVEIDGMDRPALSAIWLGRFYFHPTAKDA